MSFRTESLKKNHRNTKITGTRHRSKIALADTRIREAKNPKIYATELTIPAFRGVWQRIRLVQRVRFYSRLFSTKEGRIVSTLPRVLKAKYKVCIFSKHPSRPEEPRIHHPPRQSS